MCWAVERVIAKTSSCLRVEAGAARVKDEACVTVLAAIAKPCGTQE